MKNIFRTIKELPTWEKVVVTSLMFAPIPCSIGIYFGVKTIVKKMKTNLEKKKLSLNMDSFFLIYNNFRKGVKI